MNKVVMLDTIFVLIIIFSRNWKNKKDIEIILSSLIGKN